MEPYMQVAQKDDWETPHDLFDQLWEEDNGFDLDPCCNSNCYTAKRILTTGGKIYTLQEDGLKQDWFGKVFMNPPHGRHMIDWIAKAVHEVEVGHVKFVKGLVPVRTDTRWWQKYILLGVHKDWPLDGNKFLTEVRFIAGRLKFVGGKSNATFPSAIIMWTR